MKPGQKFVLVVQAIIALGLLAWATWEKGWEFIGGVALLLFVGWCCAGAQSDAKPSVRAIVVPLVIAALLVFGLLSRCSS